MTSAKNIVKKRVIKGQSDFIILLLREPFDLNTF